MLSKEIFIRSSNYIYMIIEYLSLTKIVYANFNKILILLAVQVYCSTKKKCK